MSWFSDALNSVGIDIPTPDFIKKIGDVAGAAVVNAVPGGSVVNSVFDLTNTHGGTNLNQLATQTVNNLGQQVRAGQAAITITGNTQAAYSNFSSGLSLLVGSPIGLAGLALVVYLIVRKH